MRKLILLLLFLGLTVNSYSGAISRHTTYTTNSEVTSTNLNGNFDNIVNECNGGLDNTNIDTVSGYRLFEIVGALPTVGTQGRIAYLTTSNTLNFDTGAAWNQALTVSGTPAQGDILYYSGTAWARLTAGTSGQVLTSQGASANPKWAGAIQMQYTQSATTMTGTGTIPEDDTTPQKTEGDEYLTVAITPTSATSKLKIDVLLKCQPSSTDTIALALFKDSDAGALVTSWSQINANIKHCIPLTYCMTSGTTSEITFKVRAGLSGVAGGTLYVNCVAGAPTAERYNDTLISSISVTEFAQ